MNPKLIQALLKILRESPAFMEKLASKQALARTLARPTKPIPVKVPLSPMMEAERALSGFPQGSTTHIPGKYPGEMSMEAPRPPMTSGVSPEAEEVLPELLQKIYGGTKSWR